MPTTTKTKRGVTADGGHVVLRGRAAELWRDVQAHWSLNSPALELLRCAVEALARADEAAEIVTRDGPVFVDREMCVDFGGAASNSQSQSRSHRSHRCRVLP
jgi:hypothetical protein